MDALTNLLLGFSVALTPINLLWCFIGVVLGTAVGVLPGLGPAATIAMLLPLTLRMDHTTAIIALAGIFYGARYGGSTTSILLNMPGESSSVATCLDGYQMARNGRAGVALGISAIASFIAGTVGVLGLMLISPPLARFGLRFAPPEYFALMTLGLTMVVFLAGDSMVKALLALFVGIWMATIGTDLFTAESRFTFGHAKLLGGLDFIAATVGIFAVAEVLINLESRGGGEVLKIPRGLKNLLPTLKDLRDCRFAFLNGSVIGFVVGALPGAGATVASFLSYGLEKAVSRHPEKFGTGVVEGVAAPEGANNADAGGALVPLLTLGIPGGNTTAILLGGLILWGYRPGPLLIQEHPQLFWGLVASMYVGNVLLLVLNLPLVPLFAQILRLPHYILMPFILGISAVGVYSVNNSLFDVWIMALFGLLGYVMRKLDYPAAALILGLVLGDVIERALRQSLMMSQGDLSIFVTRPISASLLLIAIVLLCLPAIRGVRAWRVAAIEREG
jgi:putative tricarboxylic transport membrane protein